MTNKFLRRTVNKVLLAMAKRNIKKARNNPELCQQKIFKKILKASEKSLFGQDFDLSVKDNLSSYQKKLKINSYEDYKPYIDKILVGKPSILWEGLPNCITISSGTTSGHKYVPIYKDLLRAHYSSSLYAGLNFCLETNEHSLLDNELFYLTGLQNFSKKGGVPFGHLGAMAKKKFPTPLLPKLYPPQNFSFADNWDQKIDKILDDIPSRNISLFAGTPPWQVDFLKKFKAKHKKNFGDLFSDFKLFIHSGCSFEPYRQQVFDLIGDKPNYYTMEMLPASEGFIAFQDKWGKDKKAPKDMLLNVNSNLFFEFLPIGEDLRPDYDNPVTVKGLEVNKTYALVISVLGGFLRYQIGDNVTITSLKPIRLKFAGRSRFNVNLIGEHMDYQTIMNIFLKLKEDFAVDDFSLLPKYSETDSSQVYYQWYFSTNRQQLGSQIKQMETRLHKLCCENNAFFKAISHSGLIQPTKVSLVGHEALREFIKDKSSVGQNKVLKIIQQPELQKKFEDFAKNHLLS